MTVIVGIDGPSQSVEALQFAAGEAKVRQNPLRVVHVFDVPVTGSWTAGQVVDPETVRTRRAAAGRPRLHGAGR